MMTKRSMLMVLTGGLLLSLGGVVACGPSTDTPSECRPGEIFAAIGNEPARCLQTCDTTADCGTDQKCIGTPGVCVDDTPSTTNNPPGGDNNPPGGDNNPPGGDNNPPGGDNNPPGGDNNPPGGDNNPPGGDNNPPGDDCELQDWYYGQIYSEGSSPHDGGVPVPTPMTESAGLQAVLDAIEPAENHTPQTFDPPLVVTNAIVTATTFTGSSGPDLAQSRFWVQDADVGMRFWLIDPDTITENLQVGQKVSFKVTEARVHDGHPQISAVTDFVIHSSGNEVSFREVGTSEITMDDYYKIVRVAGKVGSNSWDCGGGESTNCWDLNYGDTSVILRTSSSNVSAGTCVTFIGPVLAYPGSKAPSGNAPVPQLDTINFRWIQIPRTFND